MTDGNLSFETEKCLIFGKGNKVRNLRMLKKLTPGELADLADVPEEYVESVEHQKTEQIDTNLTQIANALNIDVELLLDSSMCLDNHDMYLLHTILQNHKTELNLAQLQTQIMNLINIILYNNRKHWAEMRKNSISVLCKFERRNCARNARKSRNEKYASLSVKDKLNKYNAYANGLIYGIGSGQDSWQNYARQTLIGILGNRIGYRASRQALGRAASPLGRSIFNTLSGRGGESAVDNIQNQYHSYNK